MFDAIGRFIEWVANDAGVALATIFPFLLLGLVGLYLLTVIVGYLRVSQIGLADEAAHAGVAAAPLPRLPGGDGGSIEAVRGVPFCPVDGTVYPAGAVYCARDESDLVVNCTNCGTRIGAADDTCFHCGTRQPQATVAH